MNEDVNRAQQDAVTSQKRAALIALLVLVAVVVAALVAYRVLTQAQPSQQANAAEPYAFTAQTGGEGASVSPNEVFACEISTSDNQAMMLADIAKEKPAVVNVWATWCPYCVDEMGYFQALYEKYGDNIQFVMLDACDTAHEATEARNYVADNGYTFPVFYDMRHDFLTLYGIRGLPTTVILSFDGQTLLANAGRIDPDRMDATLAKLAI